MLSQDSPTALDGLPVDWPHGQQLHSSPSVPQTPPNPDPPSEKPLPDTPISQDAEILAAQHQPAVPSPSSRVTSDLDDPAITDLGWSNDPFHQPHLITGISNDDVFMLVRRFNKQVQHVRAIPHPPGPGSLDLESAVDEQFSPDKLRANLERLYMTFIVGMAAFGKHIARLRSWNEPRRTAAFCAAYFLSWYLSLLPALLAFVLLVIILHPPTRRALFPPAPLAAISATSGNLQVPRAGILGSLDSLSGAPEAHPGEAVEQEASQFVGSLAAIGVGTVMGQGSVPKRSPGGSETHNHNDAEGELEAEVDRGSATSEDSIAGALPDPTEFALKAKNVKDTANSSGRQDPAAHVAKKSVEGVMWEEMRPVMHALADIADTWERFSNALEPVPPFPKWSARIRLALLLAPLLVAALVIPAVVVVHATMFVVGILFFSQPVLSRLTHRLTHRFPHWRKLLELRRTLLKGVPTNAQLTITLLRLAEVAKAPLPPAPIAHPHETAAAVDAHPAAEHPPQAAEELKRHDFAFDTEGYEIEGVDDGHAAVTTDEEVSEEGSYIGGESTDGESVDEQGKGSESKKTKRGSKLVGFIRKTARAGVGGILGVDHLKAKVGNEHSKRRLGAIARHTDDNKVAEVRTVEANAVLDENADEKQKQRTAEAMRREGPTSFSARVHGKKGRLLLVTSAASPCLAFVPEKPLRAALAAPSKMPGMGGDEHDGIKAEFTVGLSDVASLRKIGGFGWKGRLLVGWATGREVVDGLEVTDRWGGRWVMTAIRGRDELFNRLVAMGGQEWDCL